VVVAVVGLLVAHLLVLVGDAQEMVAVMEVVVRLRHLLMVLVEVLVDIVAVVALALTTVHHIVVAEHWVRQVLAVAAVAAHLGKIVTLTVAEVEALVCMGQALMVRLVEVAVLVAYLEHLQTDAVGILAEPLVDMLRVAGLVVLVQFVLCGLAVAAHSHQLV